MPVHKQESKQQTYEKCDILDDQENKLRAAERDTLRALATAIGPLEPDAADVRKSLHQAAANLDELFLLVMTASSTRANLHFPNALLALMCCLRASRQPRQRSTCCDMGKRSLNTSQRFGFDRTYPADFLREISIINTPGTNAIIRRHEELTRTFVPRSDMVLFITSADRPFSESERSFMETIKEWGKKIVLILNKIDMLSSEEDLHRVMQFIGENSVVLLGQKPDIFPVSARLAKRARATATFAEREALLKASRMDVLEKHIFTRRWTKPGACRLKLSTPLGVANRVLERYKTVAHDRLDVLAEDFKTVQNIEESPARIYGEDMRREFDGRLANIENIVYELKERGDLFFNETLRMGRIRDLLNAKKIRIRVPENGRQ